MAPRAWTCARPASICAIYERTASGAWPVVMRGRDCWLLGRSSWRKSDSMYSSTTKIVSKVDMSSGGTMDLSATILGWLHSRSSRTSRSTSTPTSASTKTWLIRLTAICSPNRQSVAEPTMEDFPRPKILKWVYRCCAPSAAPAQKLMCALHGGEQPRPSTGRSKSLVRGRARLCRREQPRQSTGSLARSCRMFSLVARCSFFDDAETHPDLANRSPPQM